MISEKQKRNWKRYYDSEVGQAMKRRHAEAQRIRLDRQQYGLIPGEREEMELAQGGVCAICGRPPQTRRLAVDHCHKCAKVDPRGSVRGLLCMQCNRAIYNENPALLRRAADYFDAHWQVCPKGLNAPNVVPTRRMKKRHLHSRPPQTPRPRVDVLPLEEA